MSALGRQDPLSYLMDGLHIFFFFLVIKSFKLILRKYLAVPKTWRPLVSLLNTALKLPAVFPADIRENKLNPLYTTLCVYYGFSGVYVCWCDNIIRYLLCVLCERPFTVNNITIIITIRRYNSGKHYFAW